MSTTTIEWTHVPGYRGATWNPLVGCSRKSSGCSNCYAEVMAARIANAALAKLREKAPTTDSTKEQAVPVLDAARKHLTATQVAYMEAVRWRDGGYDGPKYYTDMALPQWSRKLLPLPHALSIPLRTKKPTAYFVNSMSDLFHEEVDFGYIDQVFAVMAFCPQHIFIVLTKRPERMAEYLNDAVPRGYGRSTTRQNAVSIAASSLMNSGWKRPFPYDQDLPWPLPNVWLGTSVEDQATADARIPHLLKCPAAVRFLSCEPLLGPVNFRWAPWINYEALEWRKKTAQINELDALHGHKDLGLPAIDWVIAGGESGHGARPMHPDWARSLRDQCKAAGVPFFFKQWGRWSEYPVPERPTTMKDIDRGIWFSRNGHRFSGDTNPFHQKENARVMIPCGKHASGRLLDGVEHNGWPAVITAQTTEPCV